VLERGSIERAMSHTRTAFGASTGRTATMFLASTLNALPGVVGLHEGHVPGERPEPVLPLINLQNLKAWHDADFAAQVVAERRNPATFEAAADGAALVIDFAFYNAPLLPALLEQNPGATAFAIFRRCETFVRSATILTGEDRQPAGWPDTSKPLTDRERFIALGRLRPAPDSPDAAHWPAWSAIQRNIWLWHTVNAHLLEVTRSHDNCHRLLYEDLVEDPRAFWTECLDRLGLLDAPSLARCIEHSARRLNQRPSYQIGPRATWHDKEAALYERLAPPLEREIYD